MPTSTSSRSRQSLEYDADTQDPRLNGSRSSLNLDPGLEEYETPGDVRPQSSSGSNWMSRSLRQRQSPRPGNVNYTLPFSYPPIADGETIRLVVLKPGTESLIECALVTADYKRPPKYRALSYCWESRKQEGVILCNGYTFRVTLNLLNALKALRQRDTSTTLWIDQICICQKDDKERAHQVNIMKHIYSNARGVIVWLGETADNSDKLFDFAEKMRRGRSVLQTAQNRLLPIQQRKRAVQKLLLRPWFYRVWTIQEVALSTFTTVACGSSRISWNSLVRLIKDVQLPKEPGFQKTTSLLGNTRQRIAILTEMAASQKAGLAHADITQLLILAKGSQASTPEQASDPLDKIYAFYGLTHISTYPKYTVPVEELYVDITIDYINNIQHVDSYAAWHQLSDEQRSQQLMSILYSAGSLSQTRLLPSWVPDWDCEWLVTPLWCQATANSPTKSSLGGNRNNWTSGLRSQFRAGGNHTSIFEVLLDRQGRHRLRVKAIILDTIREVDLHAEPSRVVADEAEGVAAASSSSPTEPWHTAETRYGRHFFMTTSGLCGIAQDGIHAGDVVVIVAGGDVPVVLRPCKDGSAAGTMYKLMCECSIRSDVVMYGEILRKQSARVEEIVII